MLQAESCEDVDEVWVVDGPRRSDKSMVKKLVLSVGATLYMPEDSDEDGT